MLVQQNAVFHLTDSDSSIACYDANPDALYNLARSGKILEMVRDKYGDLAKSLVQDILVFGHVKISTLVEAYKDGPGGEKKFANGIMKEEDDGDYDFNANGNHVNGVNGLGVNGSTGEVDGKDLIQQVYFILARLLAAGILEPVSSMVFQSPNDLKTAIEQEVIKADFPTGIRGVKQKKELEGAVAEKVKEFQQGRTALKRRLEAEFDHEDSVKRRKLLNGGSLSNGSSGTAAVDLLKEYVSS